MLPVKERFHSLDSVRGIAALQVIIAHSLVAVPGLNWMRDINKVPDSFISHLTHSPLHFFWSDTEPVIVFFVLSGFVLSLSYFSVDRKSPDYSSFFIKRLIRLYIPCFMILCISIIFKFLLYRPNVVDDFGEWVKMMWTLPLNYTVLKNIFILNSSYLDYFDRSLWSLGPEIKLSLILPVFIFLTKRLTYSLSILSVVIFFCIYHLLVHFNLQSIWSEFSTLYYFTFFLLGSLICKYRSTLLSFVNQLTNFQYFFLIFIAIYLYTFNFSMWWLPPHIMAILRLFSNQITSIAAAILIVISLSDKAKPLLNNKILLFLGEISFSIYLVHAVVITVFAYLLQDYISIRPTVFFAFICCFPLSYLFYRIIEQPSLRLAISAAKYYKSNSRIPKLVKS